MDVWRESRIDALGTVSMPGAWADLALINILRANTANSSIARREHLLIARDTVREAIQISPGNGFRWLRLAMVESELGASPSLIFDLVDASIATAPYEPGAIRFRVELIFDHWNEADDHMRSLAAEQIAYIPAAVRWRELRRLAKDYPERGDVLRAALADNERAQGVLDDEGV